MKSTYIPFIIFLFSYLFPQAQSAEKEINFDKDQMDKIILNSRSLSIKMILHINSKRGK